MLGTSVQEFLAFGNHLTNFPDKYLEAFIKAHFTIIFLSCFLCWLFTKVAIIAIMNTFICRKEIYSMSIKAHADQLKNRHQQLEEKIRLEMARPAPDQKLLSELKRQKLQLKQEIDKLGNEVK